jgi:hypothetical protein
MQNQCFSVRVSSHSWQVPISNHWQLAILLYMAFTRFPGAVKWTCMHKSTVYVSMEGKIECYLYSDRFAVQDLCVVTEYPGQRGN